jgi:hypothetical protein
MTDDSIEPHITALAKITVGFIIPGTVKKDRNKKIMIPG